jgi:hypothetical protein
MMSTDYAPPLEHMIETMRAQMARPENVAKTSWLDVTFDYLEAELDRNLNELKAETWRGPDVDVEAAYRRAANVANLAWMIADRSTHDAR